MDRIGSRRDDVFAERLWHSAEYQLAHLSASTSVGEARASIGGVLTFYNGRAS